MLEGRLGLSAWGGGQDKAYREVRSSGARIGPKVGHGPLRAALAAVLLAGGVAGGLTFQTSPALAVDPGWHPAFTAGRAAVPFAPSVEAPGGDPAYKWVGPPEEPEELIEVAQPAKARPAPKAKRVAKRRSYKSRVYKDVPTLYGTANAAAGLPASLPGGTARGPQRLYEELTCLALNIYFEARGEDYEGQHAVAHVVMNRVKDVRFPESICAVVRQGGEAKLHRCQFSWWCDGLSDRPRNIVMWRQSQAIAQAVYWGYSADPTEGALWYHADYVMPYWGRVFKRGPKIGRHLFYVADEKGIFLAARHRGS